MPHLTVAVYQIDARWQIVSANEAFCRTLHCTESSLIGRDARELLRQDWRDDFRHYVSRALVGVGGAEATVPFVAPCGQQAWFTHSIEPLTEDGLLVGYRASIQPHAAADAAPPRHWWTWRRSAVNQVWDSETNQIAKAS